MENAIIVAGHAVLRDTGDVFSDASWHLLDFQRGEAACYVAHVRRGVELAAADPGSLLIFAGGQSRLNAGPQSEASGYWRVADHLSWFGFPGVRPRAITEEFSRDSFENLLFGICRFREYAGAFPKHVTLVSWAFKRDRFHLHRAAIRFPTARFSYDGPNDPPEIAQALASEAQARARYSADPYSSGPEFRLKREQRNPFRLHHGYRATSPELDALFSHPCPDLFSGPLPWD